MSARIVRAVASTLGLVALVATAGGCTIPVFEKPVTVSTKSMAMPPTPANTVAVRGESCSRVVLLIIPAGFGTSESAFAEALTKAQADTLVNWRIHEEHFGLFPFYFHQCIVVEGQAAASGDVLTAAGRGASSPSPATTSPAPAAADPAGPGTSAPAPSAAAHARREAW